VEKKIKSEAEKNNFLTIGEVAEKTGVKAYILRYWEKEFPFLQPVKNRAGHRTYTKRDMFIIRQIKKLMYEKGYSIAGAKNVLWDVLLGRRKNSRMEFIEEIRKDLNEMLNAIDQNLS